MSSDCLDLHNVKELIQNCIKPHKVLTSLWLSLYLPICHQRVVVSKNYPLDLFINLVIYLLIFIYLLILCMKHVEENPTSLQVLSPLPRIKHLYLCYVPENESSFWLLSISYFLTAALKLCPWNRIILIVPEISDPAPKIKMTNNMIVVSDRRRRRNKSIL